MLQWSYLAHGHKQPIPLATLTLSYNALLINVLHPVKQTISYMFLNEVGQNKLYL